MTRARRTATGDWMYPLEGDFQSWVIDEWLDDADMPGPIDAPDHIAAGSHVQSERTFEGRLFEVATHIARSN